MRFYVGWYNLNKAIESQKRPKLRIYLDSNLDKLVNAIATIRDESISAVVAEALELWLQQPQQQEIVEKHRLDKLD
uniref:hypothetical protein n=1 Tax=Trichocoleus desertorum TaxID=1481672 RepID=UPI0025B5AE32|nr:hypothetical protein [Trichocoleus desertorum]